ncbi:MAG: transposase [Cyclobacteriaceae bacterium]
MESTTFKLIVTDSLTNLSNRNLIEVFAFVVMPNHIHLIWRLNKLNGKELPSSSLLKFTSHQFKKILPASKLPRYYVDAPNKTYEFWQRDSLAIELYSPEVIYQKLDYTHNNPLDERWNLVNNPIDYEFSSAAFYENEISPFRFLKHIGNEL